MKKKKNYFRCKTIHQTTSRIQTIFEKEDTAPISSDRIKSYQYNPFLFIILVVFFLAGIDFFSSVF